MLKSLFLASALCAASLPAMADDEPICMTHTEALKLAAKIGQVVQSRGEVSTNGVPVLLTANPDTGRWAVWMILGERACLFAEN